MVKVSSEVGSTETTAVQMDGQPSPGFPRPGTQAGEGVGLVELDGDVLRGLGGCKLASHRETESVLRSPPLWGGRAPWRQKAVEEQQEQEREKRGIMLERMVKFHLLCLLWGLCRETWNFPHLWGFSFPI